MSLKVSDVDLANDFDELIEVQWAAFEKPFQSFVRLICPIHGTGPNARQEALKESTGRQLDWSKMDPRGHWQKVVNADGKIVGGALWKVFSSNPYDPPKESPPIYWYPEGGQRDFVAAVLTRLETPRAIMGARPQVFLNIMFTHPDYRQQGVGSLLMKWGVQKADEMGVEMWLNATDIAMPLYKSHGFIVIEKTELSPTTENPSDEWIEIRDRLKLEPAYVMWRPIGGKYEEGKTVKPWEN